MSCGAVPSRASRVIRSHISDICAAADSALGGEGRAADQVVMARRMVSGEVESAAARAARVAVLGCACPSASQRLTVETPLCAAVASSSMDTPAANLSQRRSGPPSGGSSNSRASTPNTPARACKVRGLRGRASPLSQRETRFPAARPARRASSFWLMPARSRARRRASPSRAGACFMANANLVGNGLFVTVARRQPGSGRRGTCGVSDRVHPAPAAKGVGLARRGGR